MTQTGSTLAQAKINLFLRVLAKEESGFHSIETLFLRLELGDRVSVRITDLGRAIDCTGLDEVAPEDNLAFRAAVAFQEAAAWPRGFAVEVTKLIPARAGLGGGSSDAGAVLRILNALAPAPLTSERLLGISAKLGSDVPFLATESAMALAWGRGERMLSLPPLPSRPVLLAIPGFSISTAEAYAKLASAPARTSPPPSRMLTGAGLSDWASVAAIAQNDFEPMIGEEHPELHRLVDALARTGAIMTRMSGSGSAVFSILEEPLAKVPREASTLQTIHTRTAGSVVPVTVSG